MFECGICKKEFEGRIDYWKKLATCGCDNKSRNLYKMLKKIHSTDNISKIPIYNSWMSMRRRCLDKKCKIYKNYGGRGITICDRWRDSFVNFYEDMGPLPDGHTIDRIDNDGGYYKNNCKWSTPRQQCNNKRNTRYATINGDTKSFADWSRELNISISTINSRVRRYFSNEEAVTTPVDKNRDGWKNKRKNERI